MVGWAIFNFAQNSESKGHVLTHTVDFYFKKHSENITGFQCELKFCNS